LCLSLMYGSIISLSLGSDNITISFFFCQPRDSDGFLLQGVSRSPHSSCLVFYSSTICITNSLPHILPVANPIVKTVWAMSRQKDNWNK
jgi:hypothetical protein